MAATKERKRHWLKAFVSIAVTLVAMPLTHILARALKDGTAGVYLLAIYFIIFWWRPSVQYCWFVEYIYWIVTLSISFFYLKKANWKNKKI